MLSLSSLVPSKLPLAAAKPAPIVAVLLLATAACLGGTPADKEVLIALTDEVVVPAYRQLAEDSAELDSKAAALCSSPSEAALEDTRRAWQSARASWLQTSAMSFGPVMDRRSESLLDWSPTDTVAIDESVADTGFYTNADQVRNSYSAGRRGFGAMEYLLYRDGALEAISRAPSACGYLLALTQLGREETVKILGDWTEGGEQGTPYRDYFTDRASLSLIPGDAVEEVVRTQVFLIRDIVHMRMATSLGLRGDGTDLTAIPGNAADNGLDDLRNELIGMQRIYEGSGADSPGISALVQPLSEETDQRLREQLGAAIQAVDEVEGPLKVAIKVRPEQVNALYDRLADIQLTLATEVVSLLGVSVGFSDTDGDTLR